MINDVPGKLIADKYRVESLIRESESGDLYVARHEVLDKPVVLKVLSSQMANDQRRVKRFVDEARSASTLTHPNILGLTDFGTDARGVSYAVFESASDATLADIISVEPSFGEKRSLDIARQIASAVSAAHTKNVIHGRLDPRNIFVDSYGGADSVKVYGFGSNPLDVARDADPRYLSPEQCNAFPAADERSDVYAIGVMLYEMLSGGVVPYDGRTAADVLAKQNSEPPAPLSAFRKDLHPEIEPIVLSAIAADPDKRYQTMNAFVEDLDTVANRVGTGEAASPATAGSNRNVWQTAFIVLAGICLLSVALIYAMSTRKTDPTTQLQADAGSLPVQPIGPATGAQEESLAKLPPITDAEIMATAAMEQPPGTLPGGDGFNAWANGGVPPPGAPLQNYVPPGGQVYTIDPNTGSQFMPNENGIVLVPVPAANTAPNPKATATPKGQNANTAVQPTPAPAATAKPLATPPAKTTKPGTTQQPKGKAPTSANPSTSAPPKDS